MGAGMVPMWSAASRRVQSAVGRRSVPLLAFGAAYCFLVMLFNVPIPDGTTAHAIGAVLVAVLLGPWAAVVAVSVAVAIQALFFGDGGVLAFGANCFNMAVVMPFAGVAVHRLLGGRRDPTSRRSAVAAGVGGYVGITAAALCAAIELGVQPDLFTRANGTPLYSPYHLSQTIPTMVGAHLLVAGFVEAALTYGVLRYLQRAQPALLGATAVPVGEPRANRARWRWAGVGLAAMVVLSPLGLLASGGAFAEDAPARGVLAGYDFGGDHHRGIGYIASAAVGAVMITAVVWLLARTARLRRAA